MHGIALTFHSTSRSENDLLNETISNIKFNRVLQSTIKIF